MGNEARMRAEENLKSSFFILTKAGRITVNIKHTTRGMFHVTGV